MSHQIQVLFSMYNQSIAFLPWARALCSTVYHRTKKSKMVTPRSLIRSCIPWGKHSKHAGFHDRMAKQESAMTFRCWYKRNPFPYSVRCFREKAEVDWMSVSYRRKRSCHDVSWLVQKKSVIVLWERPKYAAVVTSPGCKKEERKERKWKRDRFFFFLWLAQIKGSSSCWSLEARLN